MRSIVIATFATLLCTTLANAAPRALPKGSPTAPKGVGPNVFKKAGLPAIELSKVQREPLPAAAAAASPSDAPPEWMPPPTEPITSELQFDVAHPSSGAIGIAAENMMRVESVARFNMVPGYHFLAGKGKIGIWMPSTAISGKQVIMSCHGDLPSKMRVVMHEVHPGGTSSGMLLMQLHNLVDRASFYVDVGTIGPASMVFLQLEAATEQGGQWRADGCSIKPA